MTTSYALMAFAVMGIATFLTRAFPFVFLRRYENNACLRYIGQRLPPAVMLLLVIYCLKDLRLEPLRQSALTLLSVGVVALLHLWWRNALLSIGLGTAFFLVIK